MVLLEPAAHDDLLTSAYSSCCCVGYYVLCLVKQLLGFGSWLSAVAFGILAPLRAASGNKIPGT